MIHDPKVVVYSTDHCALCERAKRLLEARGVAYREVLLPRTAEGRALLHEIDPRARTFPQVVIEGRSIGGFRELRALDETGRLMERVK